MEGKVTIIEMEKESHRVDHLERKSDKGYSQPQITTRIKGINTMISFSFLLPIA